MAPGRYTELFFLDDATALAAGHRPCAECRREDYNRLVEIWSALHPDQRGVVAIDTQLHRERLIAGTRERRLHEAPYAELPDGAFVIDSGMPCLVLGRGLLVWSPRGYLTRRRRPAGGVATLITPPSLVALIRDGWTPRVAFLHPTANDD
jgi:hypothetical protein